VFEGVPYAAAPVGYLRWRAPEPHANWSGVLTADHFGGNCMQATQEQQANPASANRKSVWTIPFLIPQDPITEDCLYLNVWTGASSSSGRRPVIVWIHGGGFQSGSGSVPLYDGSAMAKKGVVFVTINYRLGVFGFLALRELSGESSHHASGDYGLLDQIAALQMGAAEHRGFRRGSGERDDRRPVGRVLQRQLSRRFSAGQRPVPARHW
jgi:para-nitrobenzyl esterase